MTGEPFSMNSSSLLLIRTSHMMTEPKNRRLGIDSCRSVFLDMRARYATCGLLLCLTFSASRCDPRSVWRELHRVDVRYMAAILFDALVVLRVPQSCNKSRLKEKIRAWRIALEPEIRLPHAGIVTARH